LQTETPRATQINTLQSQLAQSNERAERLSAELNDVQARLTSISSEAGSAEQVLSDTQAELAEIKRISSNAMQLDQLTKELSAKIENVTSQNDLLLLENARLGDRVASNQRLEGVLFLVAGIVIALVLPRLTAKRRRPGGWR
jgi:SH3 domain protein